MSVQLIDACKAGDLAKVKELVNNGADIHVEDGVALRWAK